MSDSKATSSGLFCRIYQSIAWEEGTWLTLLIFLAALFGIYTRPFGFLAALWPANALLMGILIRNPRLAFPTGLFAAIVGFLAADFITGGGFILTLWLTVANLTSAYTGFFLFRRLSRNDLRLKQPLSILHLFIACLVSGMAAGLVSCYSGPLYFKQDIQASFVLWSTTEFANSILLLPLVLTVPSFKRLFGHLRRNRSFEWSKLIPAIALMISVIISLAVNVPAAIAFPLPALLWCALSYSLFTTALLTMLLCWTKMMITDADLLFPPLAGDYKNAVSSLRLGVAVYALGPLTVASISLSRNEFVKELEFMANHDFLTKALARGAFTRDGNTLLNKAKKTGERISILILDIDHFKAINDRYGHAAGDSILVQVAERVNENIRGEDLFGRIGGEEFAIILPQANLDEAQKMASRILRAIADQPLLLESDSDLRITVSIGLASYAASPELTLEELMKTADAALYKAKETGRNRIVNVSYAPA